MDFREYSKAILQVKNHFKKSCVAIKLKKLLKCFIRLLSQVDH